MNITAMTFTTAQLHIAPLLAKSFNLTAHLAAQGFHLWPGQQWHRVDFTKEMLPEGSRPLLKGEHKKTGDETLAYGTSWEKIMYPNEPVGTRCAAHCRTRRPLPLPPGWLPHDGGPCPVSEGTSLDKIRFRDGEICQCSISLPLRWTHIGLAGDIIAYRIVTPPAPKWIPWTRETCPLGERVVGPMGAECLMVEKNDICAWAGAGSTGLTYEHLLKNYKRADGTPCGTEVK